jgi:hypothetical protein
VAQLKEPLVVSSLDWTCALDDMLCERWARCIECGQRASKGDFLEARGGLRHAGSEPARPRPAPGHFKLTARQAAALRAKRARGTPMKVLMEEYGISKATLFRYLKER